MRTLALLAAAVAVSLPAALAAQPAPAPGHSFRVDTRAAAHPGRHFPHRRLQTGFVVHPFWFGPQFHIQNWPLYGFPAPPHGQRWVRYYDDAYLIDRDGRVRDTRYGLDWDRYGERWEMADGIPHYYGRGDWRPGPEDYAWVERQGGGWDYGGYDEGYEDHGYGDGYAAMPSCAPRQPCPPHGYGQGQAYYGYGHYGYGWAYPIIIETTVVTGGGCCGSAREVVRERVVAPPSRYRAPPPRPRAVPPPPPPPAGERG